MAGQASLDSVQLGQLKFVFKFISMTANHYSALYDRGMAMAMWMSLSIPIGRGRLCGPNACA
jgi:hypothetical protein